MFVRSFMSRPPLSIAPKVSASAALSFMEKHRVRRLPVVEAGTLVGIITLSDVHATLGRVGVARKGLHRRVEDLMTPGPTTVSPDDTLESVAQLMLRMKISGVPVVKAGQLVGILTESDIFRALCTMMGVGESGPRISLTVKDTDDLLEAVRKRIGRLMVRSIVTVHDARAKQWDVTVRVRGRIPD
jgi:acetoin utilization protein AcuB